MGARSAIPPLVLTVSRSISGAKSILQIGKLRLGGLGSCLASSPTLALRVWIAGHLTTAFPALAGKARTGIIIVCVTTFGGQG
jgi:hypothetical protein